MATVGTKAAATNAMARPIMIATPQSVLITARLFSLSDAHVASATMIDITRTIQTNVQPLICAWRGSPPIRAGKRLSKIPLTHDAATARAQAPTNIAAPAHGAARTGSNASYSGAA